MDKRLIIIFIFAFLVRVELATLYEPLHEGKHTADQVHYMQITQNVIDPTLNVGKLPFRYVTIVLAPVMILLRIIGISDLTATIIGGSLVSALSIIPIWYISKQLKISPIITTLLYSFAPLDIAEILTWGGYSTLFGILSINIFIYLMLRNSHWLNILILIPVMITHRPSFYYIAIFLSIVISLSLIRIKRINMWMIITPIIITLLLSMHRSDLLKYVRGMMSSPLALGLESYLLFTNPLILILSIIGLIALIKQRKTSIILLSWIFIPHILTFIPLFNKPSYAIRFLSYGVGGMAILSSFAFSHWKTKEPNTKIILISLALLGTIITIIHSVIAFKQYSV